MTTTFDDFVDLVADRVADLLDKDETWTTAEVADYLGVDPRTVRQALENGQLPGIRIGTLWRCSRRAIITAVKTGRFTPETSPMEWTDR